MGFEEALSPPRSPLQRACVVCVIGKIPRVCLNHVIVFNKASPHQHLKIYPTYYHKLRTHLSLATDAPELRPVQHTEVGGIVMIPQVGGLHHRYQRRVA